MNQVFPLGRRFNSWEEVQECKKLLEKTFVHFYARETKTLEGQRKHVPKHINNANFDLKYYSLKLCCCSGGKNYFPRGNGERQGK